ncbi:cation-translocating P-type ATPase [Sphingomonas sp. S1-29]|uniref:cation-translocating P-type ATPase n=1 Tax=Sphingomonas sp. S1-29 TaxID=2991074 RepID=UPI00223ECF9C|nr:cation-translocating P-type ATPase [Sphingomonas sp. S1-29]UZK70011.1 cation-translocating P-type ATPase [Sphingomonas sp. S1-29]
MAVIEHPAAAPPGLTSAEAAARLLAEGPNELPRTGNRSVLRIARDVLKEPMLTLLLAGGVAYLLLGSLGEALILLAFATFSVVVTIVQETRTEHVLEALRDLSAPSARVVRNGEQLAIPGREVVRGDLLLLEPGDRIAADAVLQSAIDLQVDESLLTGESVAVGKLASAASGDHRPGGEDQPFVYSGSMVTRGSGTALVTATGAATEIGRIGQSLASLDTEAPRLRIETAHIVRICAIGGALVAGAVIVLYGLLRGGWIDAVLAGIAIGMAMLPEEFPVVLTIFLAMGAWRIGQAGVLTRRAAAIETLGSATILCTDKTGTLTENRMAVATLWLPDGSTLTPLPDIAMGEPFAALLKTGTLASAPHPVDPMEIAIAAVAPPSPSDAVLIHGYGLRPDLFAMANVWRTSDGTATVAAKGAPEAIADLCRLPYEAREALLAAVNAMAERGLRVLAVASATASDTALPEDLHAFAFELLGLIGLADPVRPGIAEAVSAFRAAGLRVVMITGDYATTARAIATQAGIARGEVVTGAQLAAIDDANLARRLPAIAVFARIMPEQKLRIVEAFKAAGEIVAMTGDGVNDAPSLKSAHIGIAMGKRGTDVAREASAIVLLNDDFAAVVSAIGLGRRIYDNIRKAMGFIFAIHVPIAGLALLPLAFGLPILFGPIHIALLEMVIDPVCALVFEAERAEEDSMRRPPRPASERLFSLPMIAWSVTQGGIAFALLAGLFVVESQVGMPEQEVRALVFFALLASMVALILVNRSYGTSLRAMFGQQNKALRYVLATLVAVAMLILFVAPLQTLLRFEQLHASDLGVALAVGAVLLAILELLKPAANRAILEHQRVRIG